MNSTSEGAMIVADAVNELTKAVHALTAQVNSMHETFRQTLQFKGENTFSVRTQSVDQEKS